MTGQAPRGDRPRAPEGDGPGTREDGFTLLEVMVAFVILALVLGSAYEVFGSGARSQARAIEILAATERAESTLARVGIDLPLAPGSRMVEDGDGWRVAVEIAPERPGEAALWRMLDLVPLAVRVTATPPGGGPGVTLETLRLGRAEALP